MSDKFNCPHCGASIDYAGSVSSMTCPYCGSTAPVPEELVKAQEAAVLSQSLKNLSPWVKVFIIVIILSVLIPACVGGFGTLIAIFVGIAGPIVALIVGVLSGH